MGPTPTSGQREAGFRDRADLGLYLRSLLVRHHDTLAVSLVKRRG